MNEIVLQDLWSHSLTFYRSDLKKFNVMQTPQPRTPIRVSPNNSRKDIPNPHIQTDHPDFCVWVNHDTDLTLVDLRDNSKTCVEDFFLIGDETIIPVGISLSIAAGVIISAGFTIDPCEYRRYYLTKCYKESGMIEHSELKEISDKCRK